MATHDVDSTVGSLEEPEGTGKPNPALVATGIAALAAVLSLIAFFFALGGRSDYATKAELEGYATTDEVKSMLTNQKTKLDELTKETSNLAGAVQTLQGQVLALKADVIAVNARAEAAEAAAKACQGGRQQPARTPARQSLPASSQTGSSPAVSAHPPQGVTCQVIDLSGRLPTIDFLDASKNPKKIVVTTGAQCLKERDEFGKAYPEYGRQVERQVLTR